MQIELQMNPSRGLCECCESWMMTCFYLCSVSDMGHLLPHQLCFLLISLLACHCPAVSGLFEWLRQTEAPPAAAAAPPPPAAVVPALLAKDAQFEINTADEKFLAEAKHLEISQLDSCHYRVKSSLWAFKSTLLIFSPSP